MKNIRRKPEVEKALAAVVAVTKSLRILVENNPIDTLSTDNRLYYELNSTSMEYRRLEEEAVADVLSALKTWRKLDRSS